MRTPARIKRMLKLIEIAWQESPDLRLCQLIYAAASRTKYKSRVDLFHLEDEELEKALVELRFDWCKGKNNENNS